MSGPAPPPPPFLCTEKATIDNTAKGLTPNLNTADCTRLGFKAAIYPCTGFIPAMLAMQRSYAALQNDGTDLHACEGHTIARFFEQLGLENAWRFDGAVEEFAKREIARGSPQRES